MGTESIRFLLELATGGEHVPTQELFTTFLVEVVCIPLSLPRVEVDHNLIGNLKYIGIIGATITFHLVFPLLYSHASIGKRG
jgi:hypothetical protein